MVGGQHRCGESLRIGLAFCRGPAQPGLPGEEMQPTKGPPLSHAPRLSATGSSLNRSAAGDGVK